MPVTKIISGGQTGADRGGLEAAIRCNVPHGGWCPHGRQAEDGVVPEKYRLREMDSPEYQARTEANVLDADATVIFTQGAPTGGSFETIEFCRKHGKPYHCIDTGNTDRRTAATRIAHWLRGQRTGTSESGHTQPPQLCVLNVAGNRESKAPGIQDLVAAIVTDVLREVNGPMPGRGSRDRVGGTATGSNANM